MGYVQTGDALETFGNAARVGLSVVQDPALPEVTRLLLRLVELENAGGKEKDPNALESTRKGIGLHYAVKPLRFAVKVRQDPWLIPVMAGGAVALVYMFGVATGKSRRRR